MAYELKKVTHLELVETMEKKVESQTGIPLKFQFELASDGNLDLYRRDNHVFTTEEIKKMVALGWFDEAILTEEDEVDLFDWNEDTLVHSHDLFRFVLEKTFGEGANIAGVEVLTDCVLLNVAIPA